jgi:hypothetical protein
MDWSSQAWEAALAAMRERSSAAEILALYEAGCITAIEVWSGAWNQCHDKPDLRAELVRQFRGYPNEYIVEMVGEGLERMAAQVQESELEKRAAAGGGR